MIIHFHNFYIDVNFLKTMGEIKPSVLLDIIDRERLDDLDKVVYDGTVRFSELCEISSLSAATSDNYQLKYMGTIFMGGFFAFMGQQGTIMADLLKPLPSELLSIVEDKEYMDIVEQAKKSGLYTTIPTDWVNARQMNNGLYDAAAQYNIKPPCLRIGKYCKPEEFMKTVEKLVKVHYQLYNLRIARTRN